MRGKFNSINSVIFLPNAVGNNFFFSFPITRSFVSTSINFGLSVLKDCEFESLQFDEQQYVLQTTLLSLMANNNDTNVLFRSNMETLNEFKNLANQTLNSKTKAERSNNYFKLIEFCKNKNISPGGSADLLAISLFLYFTLKNYQ